MVLTEEEAKEKWCPISRDRSELLIPCIGSRCMWWKWYGYATEKAPATTGHCGKINYG